MEPTDDSRPFFHRSAGEVGIYLDAYDAVAKDPDSFGSHHYQLMQLRDQMYEIWSRLELHELKLHLMEDQLAHDVVPLRFEKGIVLRVQLNNPAAVSGLEKQWRSGELLKSLQTYLISPQLLTQVEAAKVTLECRLFEDELDPCREELRSMKAQNINDLDYDQQMLLRARKFQRLLSQHMLQLRDVEFKFDQKLGDFMLVLKQVLGPKRDMITIESVNHLRDLTTKAEQQKRNTKSLKDYLSGLATVEKVYSDCVWQGIVCSLLMVRANCESSEQIKIKRKILDICTSTLSALRSESTLEKVSHQEWLPKILPREQTTFLGIVSLMPHSVSNVVDIDTLLDDYMNPFGVKYGSK